MPGRTPGKPTLPPPRRPAAGSFKPGQPPSPSKSSSGRDRRLLRASETSRDSAKSDAGAPARPAVRSHDPFGSIRCYDMALAIISASSAAKVIGTATAGSAMAEAMPAVEFDRPPPGVPIIRPPARRRYQPPPALDELLETTADSLLVVTNPDGSTAFDISIRDDVFDELACRIAIRDRRVTATFRVADANLRRLLEAEAGRLRARLSDRGLTVDEIIVGEDER